MQTDLAYWGSDPVVMEQLWESIEREVFTVDGAKDEGGKKMLNVEVTGY